MQGLSYTSIDYHAHSPRRFKRFRSSFVVLVMIFNRTINDERSTAYDLRISQAQALEHDHVFGDGQADVVSMLPVIEADAPWSRAVAPFSGRSLRPAARRMLASGLMKRKKAMVRRTSRPSSWGRCSRACREWA